MDERAGAYVLDPGQSRRDDAMLPFKAVAADTAGSLSVCEFTLGPWDSGPVLHLHTSVDEALYVLSGVLLAQLGDSRCEAAAGSFVWTPRNVAHTFANAGDDPLRVLVLGVPAGLEELFADQVRYLATLDGPPEPDVMDEIGGRHGAITLGPPIRADHAPAQ